MLPVVNALSSPTEDDDEDTVLMLVIMMMILADWKEENFCFILTVSRTLSLSRSLSTLLSSFKLIDTLGSGLFGRGIKEAVRFYCYGINGM